jgi:hypothetical protein
MTDLSPSEYASAIVGVVTGVALSAAAGFRIFVPILAAATAAKFQLIQLSDDFLWLASWPALLVLGVATLTEVLAYYLPAVDHALDLIGAPAAILAGTLLTASLVIGIDEWLRWPLAIIAGGGAAGTLHAGKSLARGFTTLTTAGLLNPVLATSELLASLATAALALMIPVAVIAALLALCAFLLLRTWRKRKSLSRATPAP